MQEPTFEEAVEQILAKDTRYHREAYLFVRDALEQTKNAITKIDRKPILHVTGQQLLNGIRGHAVAKFGPMAMALFEEWGVTKCEDFGEIVFNLVEMRALAKTEEDSRTDFAGGYTFWDAFRKPFLPGQGEPKKDDESARAETLKSLKRGTV